MARESIDLVSWAERLIATPSVSRDGNRRVAEIAAQLANEVGLCAKLEERESGGAAQVTLRIDLGPEGGRDGLLLLTHLDTAAPGDPVAWTETGGDPFQPTRSLDRLYGLGAADAKADWVCKLAALAALDPGRLTRPLRLVGTYGEQMGLLGVRDFVQGGGTAGMSYALVGEPSELVAIRAHKGLSLYEAELELPLAAQVPGQALRERLRGVGAHSSTPQLGSSAIEAALERLGQSDAVALYALAGGESVHAVADLCNLDFAVRESSCAGGLRYTPKVGALALDPAPLVVFHRVWQSQLAELRRARDVEFDPDHSVGNLGLVRTRGRRVTLTFELRPIPGVDLAPALRELGRCAELRLLRESPPLSTSLDSPLIAAVTAAQEEVGLPVRVGTKAGCSEAGVLASAGLDTLGIGAGPAALGSAQRPNEYTRISELAQARDLYRQVILQLCTGAPPCSC